MADDVVTRQNIFVNIKLILIVIIIGASHELLMLFKLLQLRFNH